MLACSGLLNPHLPQRINDPRQSLRQAGMRSFKGPFLGLQPLEEGFWWAVLRAILRQQATDFAGDFCERRFGGGVERLAGSELGLELFQIGAEVFDAVWHASIVTRSASEGEGGTTDWLEH